MAMGYRGGLLRENYAFVDLQTSPASVERIPLAAFAQEPTSYRSACFGVAVISDGAHHALRRYTSLGAPQLFSLHPREDRIGRWIVRAHGDPDLVEKLSPVEFQARLDEHREDWAPQQILRAKSVCEPGPRQLDFFDLGLVPTLEQAVQQKLDQLLREVLGSCRSAYEKRHAREPDYPHLYRLAFRLIAAKLLADREYPGPWSDSRVGSVLKAVEGHYFQRSQEEGVLEDATVRQMAWDQIRQGFALQNLSVETLAYVYENTLVDPKTRLKQDIYATPRELAEYIVNQLPFESLDPEKRTVFEPFAGHAPFLLAAMGRLRTLLPAETSTEDRHEYFIRMLAAVELDAFAREVARYSLMLADYPNPNGWNLVAGDVFRCDDLDVHLGRAKVVLCNPPFGDFTAEERSQNPGIQRPNKAAEILRRVLEQPPDLLGFVLPRLFTQGVSYKDLRRRVAEVYSDTSLVVVPDTAFEHSRAETVLVIGSGRGRTEIRRRSAFTSKKDYPEFLISGKLTWDDCGRASTPGSADLWTPPLLTKLAQACHGFKTLDQVAEVHRGVEYKDDINKHVSSEPRKGFVPGLKNVRRGSEPFATAAPVYFQIEERFMRGNAHKRPWDRPKVIANAVRLSLGAWTIAAAPDLSGLVCSQNFHGIWPLGEVPVNLLAAILNGPVANVFLALQITSRGHQIRVVGSVPIPSLTSSESDQISALVREYQECRRRWLKSPFVAEEMERRCRNLLLAIDAAVLAGYDLPPRLEREVLDHFAGEPRPGPVHFDRYYPKDFAPAIPLSTYLSEEYRQAGARATMSRLEVIDDPAVTAMIEEYL